MRDPLCLKQKMAQFMEQKKLEKQEVQNTSSPPFGENMGFGSEMDRYHAWRVLTIN